jgi:hypothetical protein
MWEVVRITWLLASADEDVKEFGVYNEDLMALGQWLLRQ